MREKMVTMRKRAHYMADHLGQKDIFGRETEEYEKEMIEFAKVSEEFDRLKNIRESGMKKPRSIFERHWDQFMGNGNAE